MNSALSKDSSTTIEQRLDVVVKLLGAMLTQDMMRKEAILTLSRAGLVPKEVAGILGISPHQVSVALYDEKKKSPKGKLPSKRRPQGGNEPSASE